MWSASFESVDGLDDRGTWKEITSGPALLGCQDIYEQIALFPPCSHLHDHAQDSITSRPWVRILFLALSRPS